ncbi:UNVERIFIED_CONTAM: hypothetical protein FKN15_014249 [Acipenser sinensis]
MIFFCSNFSLPHQDLKPQAYRNAFDIPRRNLLDQLTRMRSNLLRTTQKLIRGQDEDYLHSIPVAQMGNYQEYLKMMTSPLREIDPDQPKRLHTFGNPFKQDKKGMMIDEADEFVASPQNKLKRSAGDPNSAAALKRRRSMSPLLRRPQTPPIITNHVVGKGPPSSPGGQSHQNLIKPIPLHKGVEVNSVMVVESNGERKPENWTALDGLEVTSLTPEDRLTGTAVKAESQPEDVGCLSEDGLDDRPDPVAMDRGAGPAENCEEGAPPDQEGAMESGAESALPGALRVGSVLPLDGSNAELRSRVLKEVRKPGRNYETVFQLLEEVKGPLEVHRYFIHHTIKEAARFKKRVLIQQLETALEEMEEKYRPNSVNNVHDR